MTSSASPNDWRFAQHLRRSAALAAAATVCALAAPEPAAAAPSPVVIQGVEDRDVRDALRAALPERPAPETLFDAERISEEAAARVSDWLRSEGYYAGAAAARALDDPPRAIVDVRLGRRFTFAPPQLDLTAGASADDLAAARAALAQHVVVGKPARAGDVLAGEGALVAALRTRGFAQAAAGAREAIVDHATGEMRLTFRADPGAATRLGAVRVEPEGIVTPKFLAKLPSWAPGATYSPEALTGLRRALVQTGAFSRVNVALAPESADPSAPRDVTVRLERDEPRTIQLGASWSSTEGAGLDTQWDYRNALRRADTFSLGLRLADREQRVTTGLYLPHDAGLGRARRYTAELIREQARPYDRVGVSVAAAVEAQRDVRTALTYGVSLAANTYDASAGVDNAIVLSAFANVRDDTTNDRFDPRHGRILEARVEPAVSTGSATVPFVRTIGEARGYLTPGRGESDGRFTYAGRLRLGWVQPLGGDAADLPLDRRFYAGGGGSVRGYAFQSIYPQDLIARTSPPGGQGLLETSAEVRARVARGWGVAAFVDGGAAFDAADDLDALRWGAGVGLRYDLGFGPLRFDIATPLNRRARDERVALYFSLGQAF